MKNRIKLAIEFLKEGKYFRIDNIRLGVTEFGEIEVAGWSRYLNIENITKGSSVEELEEIKFMFSKLKESCFELNEFMKGKAVVYSLYYDDYNKASISICSEKEGIQNWELKLK